MTTVSAARKLTTPQACAALGAQGHIQHGFKTPRRGPAATSLGHEICLAQAGTSPIVLLNLQLLLGPHVPLQKSPQFCPCTD